MLLIVLGGVVLLVVRGLLDQVATLRRWECEIAPWGEQAYAEIEGRLGGETRLLDLACARATAAHADGAEDEAVRMLEIASAWADRWSPDMQRMLRRMSAVSWMAAVIAPVGPVMPRQFRLRRVSLLAALARVLHQVLVSTPERFRLRAYILRHGFGFASERLSASTMKLRAGGASAEWRGVEAARADLGTLARESLVTLRTLLASLGAQPRLPAPLVFDE